MPAVCSFAQRVTLSELVPGAPAPSCCCINAVAVVSWSFALSPPGLGWGERFDQMLWCAALSSAPLCCVRPGSVMSCPDVLWCALLMSHLEVLSVAPQGVIPLQALCSSTNSSSMWCCVSALKKSPRQSPDTAFSALPPPPPSSSLIQEQITCKASLFN